MSISLIDLQNYNKKILEQRKANGLKLIDNIRAIKSDKQTEQINYPEYQPSFDYVDDLFPKKHIKEVGIFVCSDQLLNDLGYSGIGGFFERVLKTIVIRKDVENNTKGKFVGKFKIDEVIVHELLHYVSDLFGTPKTSLEIEEEFAYCYSVGYLRQKYADEQIIYDNFMPFLANIIDRKKIILKVLEKYGKSYDDLIENENFAKLFLEANQKEIEDMIEKEAYKRGKEIIDLYDSKMNRFTKEISQISDNDFDLVDF